MEKGIRHTHNAIFYDASFINDDESFVMRIGNLV